MHSLIHFTLGFLALGALQANASPINGIAQRGSNNGSAVPSACQIIPSSTPSASPSATPTPKPQPQTCQGVTEGVIRGYQVDCNRYVGGNGHEVYDVDGYGFTSCLAYCNDPNIGCTGVLWREKDGFCRLIRNATVDNSDGTLGNNGWVRGIRLPTA